MDIESERLNICAITSEMGKQLVRNPISFYFSQNLSYCIDWPTDRLRALLPIYLEMLACKPNWLGFGPWYVQHKHSGKLVGDIILQRNTSNTEVELTVAIRKEMQGKRYAQEAVTAVCDWVYRNDIHTITASCQQQDEAFQQVMKRCGFKKIAQRDGLVYFRQAGQLLPSDIR